MTKHVRSSGIPTVYANAKFRSLLEARYAVLFDLLGIKWEYEPDLRLRGYIADFVVDAEVYSTPQVPGPVLVECRPITNADEFHDVIAKISRSGWRGPAIVASAIMFPQASPWGIETPFGRAHPSVNTKHANDSSDWFPVGWYSARKQFGMGGDDLTAAWRSAGQRVQWMPPR